MRLSRNNDIMIGQKCYLERPNVVEFLHVSCPKSDVSFVSVNSDMCSMLSV